jgi:hypothetical protein
MGIPANYPLAIRIGDTETVSVSPAYPAAPSVDLSVGQIA